MQQLEHVLVPQKNSEFSIDTALRCYFHAIPDFASQGVCFTQDKAIASILSSPSLMPCHGYDIAGTREGKKRCPHAPGICLKDCRTVQQDREVEVHLPTWPSLLGNRASLLVAKSYI